MNSVPNEVRTALDPFRIEEGKPMGRTSSSSGEGRSRTYRACVFAVVAGAVLIPGPALAHVTVDPDTAEAGGYAKLAFRVPNERDDASTTRVEVVFPQDAPLGHASVKPIPGWTSTTTMKKLAEPIMSGDSEITEVVSSIVWKGGSIRAGEFQEFEVSAGRLPEGEATLAFKALQTYSSGEVVRWIELPVAAGEEPENPAPMLTVAPPEPANAGAGAAETPADAAEDAGIAESTGQSGAAAAQDPGARWLAGAGLAAGLLALVVAFRRRRPAEADEAAGAVEAAEAVETAGSVENAGEERAKARR
jgi:periplasmic copper chaperone A